MTMVEYRQRLKIQYENQRKTRLHDRSTREESEKCWSQERLAEKMRVVLERSRLVSEGVPEDTVFAMDWGNY